MHKSERRAFQIQHTSLLFQRKERKNSLIEREDQIIQGSVNQETEVWIYSKEALSRSMRSHSSQKAVAEMGTILGVRG